jgi:hypothetical protein
MYNPQMPTRKLDTERKQFLIGGSVGLFYGLLIRLGSYFFPRSNAFGVMSIGFLLLVPFAMGFTSVYLVEKRSPQTISMWLFLPWVPVFGGTVATMLVYWEGMICAVLFLPIGLLLGMLGGLTAGLIVRSKSSSKTKTLALGCVLVLPLLVTPWEGEILSRNELRTVDTSISIHASPEVVWHNIERVKEIKPSELSPSWSRWIGFPAPIDATLSFEGIGGVRHASFAGGVLFIETVDGWEPNHRLAFSIHAQSDQIPKATLDDHVRVGGEFFDVLRGEYVIETLPNGEVVLHLASKHRLTTDFNWYARQWTDAIMRDIQTTILRVIRNRCESSSG